MPIETRVREALGALADEAEGIDDAPRLWDRTRHRITARRRRRIAAAAAGAAVVVAAAASIAAVVVAEDDRVVLQHPGPPPAALPPEILAVVDGGVVALSSADGSVRREVAPAEPGFPTEAAATADGAVVVYTRPGEPLAGCPDRRDLVRVTPHGDGDVRRLLTASGDLRPMVSPDGRWVAYAMDECDAPAEVGITSLVDGRNYRVQPTGPRHLPGVDSVPLAWAPDGRLLVSFAGAGQFLVSVPLGDEQEPAHVGAAPEQAFAERAVFVSDHEVALAWSAERLSVQDVGTGERRDLDVEVGRVSSLSWDAGSGRLLVAGSGGLVVVDPSGEEPPRPIAVVDGLTSAAWLRPPVTVAEPPAPSESREVVVPDLAGLTIDAAAAALEDLGFAVEAAAIGTTASPDDTVVWQEPPAGTRRLPGDRVRVYTCGPGADCVVPPPDYVDGLAAATDWHVVDPATDARFPGLGHGSPDELGGAIAERVARLDFSGASVVVSQVVGASAGDAELWVRGRAAPGDPLVGLDLRLRAARGPDGWSVTGGEVRYLCARGEDVTLACP
jgi:hypothetical protein